MADFTSNHPNPLPTVIPFKRHGSSSPHTNTKNRLIMWSALALIVAASVQKVVITIGVNLGIGEVMCPIFLGLCALKAWSSFGRAPRAVKQYIALLWILCIIGGSSVIWIVHSGGAANRMVMFTKGMIYSMAQTLVLSTLALVMALISREQRRKIIYAFIAACLASAIYGLVQLAGVVYSGYDIDQLWVGYFSQDETALSGLSRQAVGSFYRLTGLTSDPSVFTAFAITAAPLLLALWIAQRGFAYAALLTLVLVASVLTMSISGLAGLAAALAIVTVALGVRLRARHFIVGVVVIFLVAPIYGYFQEDIIKFAENRLNPEGTTRTHLDIALNSLALLRDYPFGCGLNNFSTVYQSAYPGSFSMNPHNSFLACFVELGTLGLLARIGICAFVLYVSVRSKTIYGRTLFAAMIGACITACGYETLELTYIQLFITVLFAAVTLGDDDPTEQRDVMSRRPRRTTRLLRWPETMGRRRSAI